MWCLAFILAYVVYAGVEPLLGKYLKSTRADFALEFLLLYVPWVSSWHAQLCSLLAGSLALLRVHSLYPLGWLSFCLVMSSKNIEKAGSHHLQDVRVISLMEQFSIDVKKTTRTSDFLACTLVINSSSIFRMIHPLTLGSELPNS